MSVSRAQQASVTHQELAHQHNGEHAREAIGEGADRERSRTTEVEDGRARESQVGRILREAEERERERAIGLDDGIGLG